MLNNAFSYKLTSNLVIILLTACIYTQITSQILFTPIDFDEGYNLQTSRHLNNDILNYSTYTSKFDPNITTGPALLIPSTLFVSPLSPLLPRVLILIFAIIFIYSCQVYVYSNQLQKIAFLILLSITPLFYFFSSHVLGELPGFVFFLISLILLNRKRYYLSGIVLALSILTKQIYIFGILALLFEFTLIHIFSKKQRATISKNIALIVSGFLLIYLVWYIYILVSVNFSYSIFQKILADYYTATQALSQPKISLVDKRLEMFNYVFGVNGIIFILLILYISWQSIKYLRENHTIQSLAFYALLYILYFLFFGSSNWYRHFFPAVLALIVLLPVYLDLIFATLTRRKIILISFILLIISSNRSYNLVFHNTKHNEIKKNEQNLVFQNERMVPLLKPDILLDSQIQTASFIKNKIGKNKIISGISWWNAPEIEYLANRKIERDPFKRNTDYLITHFYGDTLAPNEYEYLDLLKKKNRIYKSEGYAVYEITN